MFLTNQTISLQWERFKSAAILTVIFSVSLLFIAGNTSAQTIIEDFAVVPVPGWTTQNNSAATGTTGWYQGDAARFPARAGAANSYVAADLNNTTGTNTISNWLISPQRTFTNGDVIRFSTRRPQDFVRPDRLQVRLSLAVVRNVGGGANGQIRWFIRPSATGVTYALDWGLTSDSYVPEDYDGDGKTDLCVVRSGGGLLNWYVAPSSTGALPGNRTAAFGASATDFVAQGDYDGDGRTDFAIYRRSTTPGASVLWVQASTAGVFSVPFGANTDYPPANFNFH